MPIPRPAFLTEITVPTGGWTWKIYISVAGAYDTALSCTIAAGTYFLANDHQTDDLCYEMQLKMAAELTAHGVSAHRAVTVGINPTTHKVVIGFVGTNFQGATPQDVKLAWTECTAGLVSALGFDASADDTSTTTDNPVFTADWQHAYGWYTDEDGLCDDFALEDVNGVNSLRARAIDGGVDIQYIGETFDNQISLVFIPRAKMYSGGIAYGAAAVRPYDRNQGLECWWREAMQGKRFRVYTNHRCDDTSISVDRGSVSASAESTITPSGVTLDIDPQIHAGRYAFQLTPYNADGAVAGLSLGWNVASNSATVITLSNGHPGAVDIKPTSSDNSLWHIYDCTYRTYVIGEMAKFAPVELPKLNRFNLTIPLMRYIA